MLIIKPAAAGGGTTNKGKTPAAGTILLIGECEPDRQTLDSGQGFLSLTVTRHSTGSEGISAGTHANEGRTAALRKEFVMWGNEPAM